jgi:hypothetical protein
MIDGAKNRAVEWVGKHRFLAAPVRGLNRESEQQCSLLGPREDCLSRSEKPTNQASHGLGSKSSESAAAKNTAKTGPDHLHSRGPPLDTASAARFAEILEKS